jgi:16S rRNA (guanine527-N7)-methyltransferase
LLLNAPLNLTALRSPEEAWIRHILDSQALLNAASFSGKSVLDIGSGGGVPGLVLRICCPDIRLTVLDATEKKVLFLQSVVDKLGLNNVNCVTARAEEFAHTSARESFDIVTARGVASTGILCELCLPFCRVDGLFLAMKEHDTEPADPERFGGRKVDTYEYTLPPDIHHCVLRFQKEFSTPEEFPRNWKKISSGKTKG